MNHALLYRAGSRWTGVTAFAAAALIHISAVAFGSFHHESGAVTSKPESTEVEIDYPPVEERPLPPIDLLPDSTPAISESDFVEKPPPSQRVIKNYRSNPIRPPTAVGVSRGHGKPNTISAPRPEYPYEARRRHLTGTGVIAVSVNPVTGLVVDAQVERSIGSPILDNSALNAFRRWRFKPGNAARVRIPVTFDLNGASY
jgi:TonB family protein